MVDTETVDPENTKLKTPKDVVKFWISELDTASKAEEDWRKEGADTWKVYKGEKASDCAFNIQWSNTETLRPALYNSRPSPDVRRRFRDADPVGKYGALVLERSLTYAIDEYDFDYSIQQTVLDVIVPGRGVTRVKYMPTFQPQADAEPDPLTDEVPQEIKYEAVTCEHVNWKKFRRGPGIEWGQVPWIAFEHEMPFEQLVEMFGEDIAKLVPMVDTEGSKDKEDKTLRSLLKTATVWEIWDKTKKEVLFISEKYPHGWLKKAPDPLRLSDFFPTPRPLYAIEDSTSLIPQSLYMKYKTQAEELNKVSRRIDKVVAAMKIRGAYASNLSELATIIEAGDNQMIPIVNASEVAALGGLDKAIWILPIDKLGGVLNELYLAREKTLQTIYEITGLGDIMRGVSNPHETLGAQQLKSQWGTLRLQRLQREVQRYIRDLLRIKGEIIAEHFQMETLQQLTGIQLPSMQDKQQMQARVQQAQASGQQVPPDVQMASQHVLTMPTWDDVMELLHSDQTRRFHVGIETDSTIEETLTRDSQGMQEAITAVVNLFNGLAPAIESGALSVDVAKTIALSMARNAKMGDAVEEALEQIQQPPPPPPPVDNSVEVAKVKAQSDQQIAQMREQSSSQLAQQKLQHEQQVAGMEMQQQQAQAQHDAQLQQAEASQKAIIASLQEQAKAAVEEMKQQYAVEIEKMRMQFEGEQRQLDRDSNEQIAVHSANAQAEQADADRDATMQQAHLSAETTKEVAKHKANAKPTSKE